MPLQNFVPVLAIFISLSTNAHLSTTEEPIAYLPLENHSHAVAVILGLAAFGSAIALSK